MSIIFGKNFKTLREKNGLYQVDLAEALGVSKSTIGFWEINRCEPSQEKLEQIADYFNVSTDFLLGREKDSFDNFRVSEFTARNQSEIQKIYDSLSATDKTDLLNVARGMQIAAKHRKHGS